ncbi:hypothetical protein HPP92_003190 [Vanilla planifolia]|uniref:CID domain-containing protein n=1 Tax=Vanilla planifolia TaxID=51239 RepID=A0A835RUQ1_VANPL|nr:hypothetical protein HPP92_003190 [Vanilla planifolia]
MGGAARVRRAYGDQGPRCRPRETNNPRLLSSCQTKTRSRRRECGGGIRGVLSGFFHCCLRPLFGGARDPFSVGATFLLILWAIQVINFVYSETLRKENMNGNGTFNPQILVDKLAKLNSSQQSIETLSHWCIFHRKKARQVVETWDRQFHHSPREQRISFLYLANDILQNSRRKGLEFVAEFWKVLPDALNDVIEKGDDFGRKAALRLVDIWEDRKVFGSRGQVLKDELLGRNSENRNSAGKKSGNEFKHPAGDLLEKILSSYDLVYDGMDEDSLFARCRTAISSIEKIEKEIGNDFSIGNVGGSASVEELKGWYNILRECVEQLKIAESSRIGLQSHLRKHCMNRN